MRRRNFPGRGGSIDLHAGRFISFVRPGGVAWGCPASLVYLERLAESGNSLSLKGESETEAEPLSFGLVPPSLHEPRKPRQIRPNEQVSAGIGCSRPAGGRGSLWQVPSGAGVSANQKSAVCEAALARGESLVGPGSPLQCGWSRGQCLTAVLQEGKQGGMITGKIYAVWMGIVKGGCWQGTNLPIQVQKSPISHSILPAVLFQAQRQQTSLPKRQCSPEAARHWPSKAETRRRRTCCRRGPDRPTLNGTVSTTSSM